MADWVILVNTPKDIPNADTPRLSVSLAPARKREPSVSTAIPSPEAYASLKR